MTIPNFEMPAPSVDPRKMLILAKAAEILLTAVGNAEEQRKVNPAADVVFRWMEPYVKQIEDITEAVELLMGKIPE